MTNDKEEMIILVDSWHDGHYLKALKTLLWANSWCIKKNRMDNVSRIAKDLTILVEVIHDKYEEGFDFTTDPACTIPFLHHALFLYTVGAGSAKQLGSDKAEPLGNEEIAQRG